MHCSSGWLRPWVAAAYFALIAALSAGLAAAQVAGKDYQVLNPAQPTESRGKVEVIEFFSYACPHCYSLQSPLSGWLKCKPADVEFKRMPAIFQDSWVPFARIYYTIDALGLVDKLHHEVFAAVHNQKLKLQDPKVLFDWAASKGVDKQKFSDAYNSFAVQSLTKRASEVTRRYNVPFTPAIVVDGRYLTGPSMTSPGNSIDYDRFFKVLDQMIAGARKQSGGK